MSLRFLIGWSVFLIGRENFLSVQDVGVCCVSRPKTESGKQAWAFICFIVAPVLPPVTTKTQIKAVANEVFKVDEKDSRGNLKWPGGASKIAEAAQERCGSPTKDSITARAQELGLTDRISAQLQQHYARREYTREVYGPDSEHLRPIQWAIGELTRR